MSAYYGRGGSVALPAKTTGRLLLRRQVCFSSWPTTRFLHIPVSLCRFSLQYRSFVADCLLEVNLLEEMRCDRVPMQQARSRTTDDEVVTAVGGTPMHGTMQEGATRESPYCRAPELEWLSLLNIVS